MAEEDISRTFGFLLHDVSRLLRQNFNREAQELGLTQAQWRTLAHLARNQGINQAALAEILEIQPITLARLIDRLEAAGWVERRRPPEDRRAFRLYLTDAAQPVIDRIHEIGDRIWEQAMAGLGESRREDMIDALALVKANMQARGAGNCMTAPRDTQGGGIDG